MSNIVDKRSELLFCYDVTDANPNGDPMDENKPRIDEETGINIVTDVRLKRTVRDYLYNYRGFNGTAGKDILVREIPAGDFIQDAKMRAEDFLKDDNQEKIDKRGIPNVAKMVEIIDRNIKAQCIDLRLFGVTLPIELAKKSKNKDESSATDDDSKQSKDNKKSSITYTGPVQFKMGRSLHPVELKHIKGTAAFASGKEKQQKSFREEYVLPDSFIAFHGIVNETAAVHTGLTNDDVRELVSAIWNGTKNLISRSKFGQMPRLLLKVTYKDKGFFIGDLDKKIKISGCDNLLKIRSLNDFVLDITDLRETLDKYADKIESIEYMMDENLKLSEKLPDSFNSLTLV